MSEQDGMWIVIAGCHLNFIPGSLTPNAPGLNRFLASEPMSHPEAVAVMYDWRSVVKSDGWEFQIIRADELGKARQDRRSFAALCQPTPGATP